MILVAGCANHLWQTTVVWLLIWALMPILSENRASVRSKLWLVASLKFLLPFAVLSWGIEEIWQTKMVLPTMQAIFVSKAVRCIETPFIAETITRSHSISRASASAHTTLSVLIIGIWLTGAMRVALPWAWQWLRLYRKIRRAEPLTMRGNVRALILDGTNVPAVFGLFRPVLLLPRDIEDRLSPEQMTVVLDHEMCHVRRRDNFQLALHTLVTAIFWFHPAVWVIRIHLLKERELACDEAVLDQGGIPELYAEGILRVCRWYLEAPPGIAAGIGGIELKERIGRILAARPPASLGGWHKALLVIIASCVVGLPIGVGVIDAQSMMIQAAADNGRASMPAQASGERQEFDVASLRRDVSGSGLWLVPPVGGRYTATNIPPKLLICIGRPPGTWPLKLSGRPESVTTGGYDLSAIMPAGTHSCRLSNHALYFCSNYLAHMDLGFMTKAMPD